MNLLAIDSGNSRIKWGLHGPGGWVVRGASNQDRLDELAFAWKNLQPASVIGSNVAGKDIQDRIEAQLSGFAFTWVEAKRSQCGVLNGYTVPGQLGPDRWAALIGARKLLATGGLVVSLGTALTVDILNCDGKFEGGIIAPGLQTMLDALKRSTRLDPATGHFAFPATNTSDAVMSGAILSLAGIIDKISRIRGNPECLLNGGDAELVFPHLETRARIVDNLVLEGLVLISGDKA